MGWGFVDGDKVTNEGQILTPKISGQILKMGKRRFLKFFAKPEEPPSPFPLPLEIKGSNVFALFSDGACRGNPGPGGWGAMGQDSKGKVLFEIKGAEPSTTNNCMEMKGALKALDTLKSSIKNSNNTQVTLYSDSQYVVKGMNQWVKSWKARGWKKADKKLQKISLYGRSWIGAERIFSASTSSG